MRSPDAPPAVVLRALVEALSDTRRDAGAMGHASAGWIADIPELDESCKALDDFCRAVEGIICVLSRLIPIRWLADVPVDASGADLSRADVGDPGVLSGVIWRPATAWPQAPPIRSAAAASAIYQS